MDQEEFIDARPSKLLFRSIISDYDLNRSICELIDNCIDIWTKNGKKFHLKITITLDVDRQVIIIEDNGGGVQKKDLGVLVGPGQTMNKGDEKIIGIFGVGTKRAVIALAEQVKITTRHKENGTYRIYFDNEWLTNDDDNWKLPLTKVQTIENGKTIIELSKLRIKITDDEIGKLKEHLGETYALFLTNKNLEIIVNKDAIKSITFENWAYPPSYEPRKMQQTLKDGDDKVDLKIIAGLINESSPAKGEYGVYFYCNERLIAAHVKDYYVGFEKGVAGLPHSDVSLVRIIVSLSGPAKSMPWNSSKSGIDIKHPIFDAIRSIIVDLVTYYSKVSRSLAQNREDQVYRHKEGKMVEIEITDEVNIKSNLPPTPKTRFRTSDKIKRINKSLSENKPWVKGLYEGVIAAEYIQKQNLDQRNRICLIILDSTFEIAMKEYLANEASKRYSDKWLRDATRDNLQDEVRGYIKNNKLNSQWKKIKYYYDLRCQLIHRRSSSNISDSDIDNYTKTIKLFLKELFTIKFSKS